MILTDSLYQRDNAKYGLKVEIDKDRSVGIFDNKDGTWISFKNGEEITSLALSIEATISLYYLLRDKLRLSGDIE